jgi:Flp pilus assembly pilin Flp
MTSDVSSITQRLWGAWLRFRLQDGQTMAEYGILIAVIAIVVVLAAVFLGSSISNLFKNTSGHL